MTSRGLAIRHCPICRIRDASRQVTRWARRFRHIPLSDVWNDVRRAKSQDRKAAFLS